MKSGIDKQTVRLFDVFVLAPYIIYVATKGSLTKTDIAILMVIGIGTFIYNGINYIKNR